MTRIRSAAIVLAVLGLIAAGSPAWAQSDGTVGEFNYSPEAQQRGQSIMISGRCVFQGTTENVDMIVTVQQGADGTGDYGFSKRFLPAQSGAISGTIEVPGDAPFGDYVIGGACRNGSTVFFSKNGPFAVVERAGATTTTVGSTTTTAPGTATTTTLATTTTTGADATTTTFEVEITIGEPDDTDDTFDSPSTTVDEFAGTRNDDDDSIGPLLLLVGIVPLVLAIAAVLVAMRRRGPFPPGLPGSEPPTT